MKSFKSWLNEGKVVNIGTSQKFQDKRTPKGFTVKPGVELPEPPSDEELKGSFTGKREKDNINVLPLNTHQTHPFSKVMQKHGYIHVRTDSNHYPIGRVTDHIFDSPSKNHSIYVKSLIPKGKKNIEHSWINFHPTKGDTGDSAESLNDHLKELD